MIHFPSFSSFAQVYDSDVPVRSAVVFGAGWDKGFPAVFPEDWKIPPWGLESHFDLALVQARPFYKLENRGEKNEGRMEEKQGKREGSMERMIG